MTFWGFFCFCFLLFCLVKYLSQQSILMYLSYSYNNPPPPPPTKVEEKRQLIKSQDVFPYNSFKLFINKNDDTGTGFFAYFAKMSVITMQIHIRIIFLQTSPPPPPSSNLKKRKTKITQLITDTLFLYLSQTDSCNDKSQTVNVIIHIGVNQSLLTKYQITDASLFIYYFHC